MIPDVCHLPLKIVHGFPFKKDISFDDNCAAATARLISLREKGFGGIVTNVGFTDYMKDGAQWRLLAFVCDECARLGMRLWLYDENGYPSGKAGGMTIAADPDYEALGLVLIRDTLNPGQTQTYSLPRGHRQWVYAGLYPCDGNGQPVPDADGRYTPVQGFDPALSDRADAPHAPITLENATSAPLCVCLFADKRLYEGTHCVHNVSECRRYIDVTNPDAVREFIRNTYEQYTTRLPEHFTGGAGKETYTPGTVEAFFTDEPSFMGCYINAGLWPGNEPDAVDRDMPLYPVLSYGRDVANRFRCSFGYELAPNLCALFLGDTDFADTVRFDYYSLMSDLYETAFFAQISDYCALHGVSFSGHILLEDDIRFHTVFEGNYFSLLRHMHTPGIDMLQSIPSLVRRDAFTPKLVSSVAHQYRRPHVMSEVSAHAQGGHVTRDQMYGSLCAQYALGVDTFTYYYSENAMETDDYRAFNAALGRIHAVTQGEHIADALVYYPIETMRMFHKPSDAQYGSYTDKENICRDGLELLQNGLLDRLFDFDYVDTGSLARVEAVDGRLLAPSGETSQALILPPCVITPGLDAVLSRLTAAGARVLTIGCPAFPVPDYVEQYPDFDALFGALNPDTRPVRLTGQTSCPGVLAMTKMTGRGRATLLCNTNPDPVELTVTVTGYARPTLMCPVDGSLTDPRAVPDGNARFTFGVTLAPCRSVLITEA